MPDLPNGTGADKPDTSTSDAMSEEAIRALVNQAVTSQLKRAMSPDKIAAAVMPHLEEKLTSFGSTLGETLQKELTPFREQMAAQTKREKELAAQQQQKPGQQDWEQRLAEQQRAFEEKLAAQQAENEKRLKHMQEQQAAAQRAAAEERRKRAETTGYASLKDALTPHLKPEAVQAVVDIFKARNQVLIDDDGNAKLRIRAALEKGMPEDDHEMPVADALPHWLKTSEAALFRPPPTENNRNTPSTVQRSQRGMAVAAAQNGGNTPAAAFERLTGQSLDDALFG